MGSMMIKDIADAVTDNALKVADGTVDIHHKDEMHKIDRDVAKHTANCKMTKETLILVHDTIGIASDMVDDVNKLAVRVNSINEKYGSTVRSGKYVGCRIEAFGDMACIMINKEADEKVLLTSDNVKICKFVRKKFKPERGKKYYYYLITFHNGEQSDVRMSKKLNKLLCDKLTITYK